MPSTTLPAAATGLPNRRTAMLSSLAGLGAAVSLPKFAKAEEAGTPGIAELSRRHALAVTRHEAACEACDAADGRVTYPEPPEALFRQNGDFLAFGGLGMRLTSGRWWYGDSEIIAYLRGYRTENETTAEHAHARAAEIVAAYDAWQVDRKVAEDVAGVTAAGISYSAAFDERDAIERRIIGLRSLTPDVLRLKVAVALSHGLPGHVDTSIAYSLEHYGSDEDAIALSILRDLISTYAGDVA